MEIILKQEVKKLMEMMIKNLVKLLVDGQKKSMINLKKVFNCLEEIGKELKSILVLEQEHKFVLMLKNFIIALKKNNKTKEHLKNSVSCLE